MSNDFENERDYIGWRGFVAFVGAILICALFWGLILARLSHH